MVAAFRIVNIPELCRKVEFSVVPTDSRLARITFRFVGCAQSKIGPLSKLLYRTLDQLNPPDANASFGSDANDARTKELVMFFIARHQAEDMARYVLQNVAREFGGM